MSPPEYREVVEQVEEVERARIGVVHNVIQVLPKVTASRETVRPARCCVYCGHGLYVPSKVARIRCPKCVREVPVQDVTLTGEVVQEQVLTAGKIVVAEDARVAANLVASSVEIAGRVLGDVLASNVCRIEETGKVAGNILCRRLDLRLGAEVEGAVELIQG